MSGRRVESEVDKSEEIYIENLQRRRDRGIDQRGRRDRWLRNLVGSSVGTRWSTAWGSVWGRWVSTARSKGLLAELSYLEGLLDSFEVQTDNTSGGWDSVAGGWSTVAGGWGTIAGGWGTVGSTCEINRHCNESTGYLVQAVLSRGALGGTHQRRLRLSKELVWFVRGERSPSFVLRWFVVLERLVGRNHR